MIAVVIPVIVGERDPNVSEKSSRPYWQKALKDQIRLKEGSEQQTCCFGVWLGEFTTL